MKGGSFLLDQIRAFLRTDRLLLSPSSCGSLIKRLKVPCHQPSARSSLLSFVTALGTVPGAQAAFPRVCERAVGRVAWVERREAA